MQVTIAGLLATAALWAALHTQLAHGNETSEAYSGHEQETVRSARRPQELGRTILVSLSGLHDTRGSTQAITGKAGGRMKEGLAAHVYFVSTHEHCTQHADVQEWTGAGIEMPATKQIDS
eukprot:1020823-Pelagomonas_calceolata.AAC.5